MPRYIQYSIKKLQIYLIDILSMVYRHNIPANSYYYQHKETDKGQEEQLTLVIAKAKLEWESLKGWGGR